MTPEERVRRVARAAREIARDPALATSLARTTGLSPEGVALALERHLETEPTDDEISALVRSAPAARATLVLLSSTVFVGALRAIAWAWAGAPSVVVRPSRREPAFATALVAALGDPSVALVPDLDVSEWPTGGASDAEVHVYGRADTLASVRASARSGVRVRGHGPGMGVAIVGRDAPIDDATRALADDVVPFDQRGCLSPRVALVEGESARAEALAAALADALERAERAVPRGAISEEERSEAARFAQAMEFSGVVRRSGASLIGVSYNLMIPPPGRHMMIAPFAGDAALAALLAPLAPHVTTIGRTEGAPDAPISHARRARLGAMQRPPLDGPVDRRPE